MDSNKTLEKAFSYNEVRELAIRLEKHDAIFSQLWQISHHTFNNEIPTACVSFDEVGQVICLEVNPKFWPKQSEKQKDFIICHEMLHVLLEHGRRAKDSLVANREANNVAMDVVVNELLVSGFGFNRKEIDPKDNLCWVSTVFKKRKDIEYGQTFEYYLNRLPKAKCGCGSGSGKGKPCPHSLPGNLGGKVLDDHSKLAPADISKMLEEAARKMSQQERETTVSKMGKEGKEADSSKTRGDESGSLVKVMSKVRIPRKRKFEAVIKTCLRKIAGDGPEETWISSKNRRIASLAGTKLILPTEVDGEGVDTNRPLVYFFLDTSGSCSSLAPRFWRLACSVPKNVFDIRMFCFDTKTYEINFREMKLYGFGGTRFDILERRIQQDIGDKGKYPDAVFVITDGYGNQVNPQKPKNWHVLNVTKYYSKFPKEVNKYDLADFE